VVSDRQNDSREHSHSSVDNCSAGHEIRLTDCSIHGVGSFVKSGVVKTFPAFCGSRNCITKVKGKVVPVLN